MYWNHKAVTSQTYMTPDGGWTTDIAEAKIFTDEERDELNSTRYMRLQGMWDSMWVPVGEDLVIDV